MPKTDWNMVKKAIREVYTWPGGYPMYLVCTDGGALCMKCGRSEFRNICDSTKKGIRDGWAVAGVDVNWEDVTLTCDHCGNLIECAYAPDPCKMCGSPHAGDTQNGILCDACYDETMTEER